MALNGSTYKAFARHRINLTWTATQNVGGNYSDVTAELRMQSMDAYGAMYAPVVNNGSITINGTKHAISANSNLSAWDNKLLGKATQRVPHNADGTKSFGISGTYYVNVTFAGVFYGNQTASGTWALNNIPRKSGVSLSRSTINIGESVNINISRASSGFTHTLRYIFGSKNGVIANKTSATTQAWTMPLDFNNVLPNDTSGWGTIYCDTYNGNTKIGESSVKITGNVPSNAVPSFGAIAIEETSDKVKAVLGAQTGSGGSYVESLSRIKFTITGETTSYSSPIKSRSITFDSFTWNGASGTTGNINKNGSMTVTASITDGRGRTATKSSTINLIPYSNPRLTLISAARTDNGMGKRINLIREGVLSNVANKNKITINVYYKENTSTPTEYVKYAPFDRVGGAGETTFGIGQTHTTSESVFSFDIVKTYMMKVTATDSFGVQALWEGSIGTALVAMSLAKKGIGIGKIWGRGALDVDGDSYFNGTTRFDGDVSIGGSLSVENGFTSQYIPANSDLNNYMYGKIGFHYNPSNAETATIKNTPENMAFSLLVERHVGIKQTYTAYHHAAPKTYVRNFYDGVWGEWVMIGGYYNSTEITPSAGFTKYGTGNSTNTPIVTRVGNVVMLTGAFNNSVVVKNGEYKQLAILPSWARPSQNIVPKNRSQTSGANTHLTSVGYDGVLSMGKHARGGDYADMGVGSWVNIDLTYLVGNGT